MEKKQLRWEVQQWTTSEIKDAVFQMLKRGFIYEAAIVQDELNRIQNWVRMENRHGTF